MKKPKIENVYLDGPTTCVAINGKIISSKEVSDMIDALIECYKLGDRVLHDKELEVSHWITAMVKTEQALKKAGCHE